MLSILRGVVYWGQRILAVLGVISLATIIISVTAGIISRYVFGLPFPWTEELATFLFIWLAFLGSGVAAAKRKHVLVDYLTCKLAPANIIKIRIVTYCFILMFLGMTAVGSILLQPKVSGHASVSLNIPKNLYYVPILIVSIYLIFVYLNELIEIIRNRGGCKE